MLLGASFELKHMGRSREPSRPGSAEVAESRRQRRRGGRLGLGRGCPLPSGDGVWGGGTAHSPDKFFDVFVWK